MPAPLTPEQAEQIEPLAARIEAIEALAARIEAIEAYRELTPAQIGAELIVRDYGGFERIRQPDPPERITDKGTRNVAE